MKYVVMLALALISLVTAVPAPVATYPSADYFSARGEGRTRTEAEVAAIRGVAAIFGQDVLGTTKSARLMEDLDGKSSISTTISAEARTLVDAEDLVGVEVKEASLERGVWTVLAVMDKKMARDALTKRVVRARKDVADLESGEMSLARYARLLKARDIARVAERDSKRLLVLGANVAAPSVVEVEEMIQGCARAIPIDVKGDEALVPAAKKVLGEWGFNVGGGQYRLTCSANFERIEGFSSPRVKYSVELSLMEGDVVLLPFKSEGRVSAKSYDAAVYDAKRIAVKKVEEDFTKSFASYLNTLGGL